MRLISLYNEDALNVNKFRNKLSDQIERMAKMTFASKLYLKKIEKREELKKSSINYNSSLI